ncbi:MAG: pentapeptide repeat-containing protein [Micavibrio sp.]|nr:pentapeptide repeat-containing protein [Micavibrio sp.]
MSAADNEFVSLTRMMQAELNEIIRKHQMFLTAKPGGARAVIRDRDLTDLSFIGQNLSQSDFTGCIMRDADMSGANFESATLFGCDLRGATINNTRLVRADMRGAEITAADLAKADMSGADLRQGRTILKRKMKSEDDIYNVAAEAGVVQFNGSDLTGAILNGATAIAADFSDAILENAKMQNTNLKDSVLRGADLTNADLSKSDLRNADFSYALMQGADISDTERDGMKSNLVLTDESIGQPVKEMPLTLDELLLMHTKWVATAGRMGRQMVLEGIDFREGPHLSAQRLTAARVNKCTFASMDLRSLEAQGANLDESDFRKCLLQSADFRGARFRGAVLQRSNFSRANMNPLVLKKPDGIVYHIPCRLEGASLRGAVFNGTRLMEARFTNCDLTGADFTDADLRGADFSGANLSEAIFEHAFLEDTVFDGVKPST